MNVRSIIGLILLFNWFQNLAIAEEKRFPLIVKSGHLLSEWRLNDSIQAKVMLETGFPKIVISENFALKHLKHLVKFEKAAKNTSIRLWGTANKIKVSYLIRDTFYLFGRNIAIDALVVDVANIDAWKDHDMIFPLKDLPWITEININGKYMIIDRKQEELQKNYHFFDVEYDENIKGLFLSGSLIVRDTLEMEEKLNGNFLLDLGAPNALFVNRDLENVENFVIRSERMLLKDTTQFKPNPHTKLGIIMPNKFYLNNISCKDEYIVAMRMFKGHSQKYSGIIGNRFFSHFIIAFDFEKKKIFIRANSDKVKVSHKF